MPYTLWPTIIECYLMPINCSCKIFLQDPRTFGITYSYNKHTKMHFKSLTNICHVGLISSGLWLVQQQRVVTVLACKRKLQTLWLYLMIIIQCGFWGSGHVQIQKPYLPNFVCTQVPYLWLCINEIRSWNNRDH